MTTQSGLVHSGPSSFRWLREFGGAVADLLFPPHCVSCHRFGAWLCADCQAEIEVLRPPVCHRCGLPLSQAVPGRSAPPFPARPICHHCQGKNSHLDGLLACALHSGPLRTAIHQFKYEGLRSLSDPLGKLMAQGWATLAPRDHDIEVIVPVPLHVTRHRQRGYNQSALLAHELGACLQRPVVEDVLVRTKATIPQVGLNAQEREANVRDAFRCHRAALAGKHILLVDDVRTTGSTLEAAGLALRTESVLSVWAYTLARAG